jgi:polyphosphate kinase
VIVFSERASEGIMTLDEPTNVGKVVASEVHESSADAFLNRELSWLAFNERVLEEASDAAWPLLERLKFIAIHASNLDEFFMIRVSGLREQDEVDVTSLSPDGMTPRAQLIQIGRLVRRQMSRANELRSEIVSALAAKGIQFVDWKALDDGLKGEAREYFRRAVFPILTPLAVDPAHPFPFISNLSLSLALEIRDPRSEERKFARVKVPESLPRFLNLSEMVREVTGRRAGSHGDPLRLLPLEELITANLGELFRETEIAGCHPIRITRDMDLEILEEEADDLLSTIDSQVRQRRFGAVVRLEATPALPDKVQQLLLKNLEIEPDDVYKFPGPLGAAALMAVAQTPRSDLRDPVLVPEASADFAEASDSFVAIAESDLLLHHPYQSFAPVLRFLGHAADDPQVMAIKMTLYRTGSNSEIVPTLIRAAENGKQVAVAIELKARFDEANNIQWARAMERAGVHVFYGRAGYKTHAKALLVVRREGNALRRYVHLSTGNYNLATSKLYTDLGLFTCDADIGEDVSEFFNSLSGATNAIRYRKLAVAPVTLADTIIGKIDGQTERARQGKPSGIFAKMNSLVDEKVIKALYRASKAGVQVNLNVRGICCLRPGVAGLSENIRVFSTVGRFLEHERLAVFGVPGAEEFYISSADWMPRNLYRRVELMCPVENPAIRERLRAEVIEPVLSDNTRVRDLAPDGTYHRRRPRDGEPLRDAQQVVLTRLTRPPLHSVPSSA